MRTRGAGLAQVCAGCWYDEGPSGACGFGPIRSVTLTFHSAAECFVA
jgi:hypothetical protein